MGVRKRKELRIGKIEMRRTKEERGTWSQHVEEQEQP